MSRQSNQKGFTIIELIIATAVFSVVLLLGLTGFIQVGKMFYKGVTIAQTRDSAKSTLDAVVSDMKLATTISAKQLQNPPYDNPAFICIGNQRYKINLFNSVNTLNGSTSSYGLLRESLSGNQCTVDAPPVLSSGSPELLGNRMRLLKFDIEPLAGVANTYQVVIKVAYAADDNDLTSADAGAQCKNSTVSTQFCAVTELSTQVYLGSGKI